jgi:hypothetical protein
MVQKDPRKTATSRDAGKAVSSGTGAAGSGRPGGAGANTCFVSDIPSGYKGHCGFLSLETRPLAHVKQGEVHPDAGTTLEIAQNRIADEPSPSMFAMASDNVISTSCRRKNSILYNSSWVLCFCRRDGIPPDQARVYNQAGSRAVSGGTRARLWITAGDSPYHLSVKIVGQPRAIELLPLDTNWLARLAKRPPLQLPVLVRSKYKSPDSRDRTLVFAWVFSVDSRLTAQLAFNHTNRPNFKHAATWDFRLIPPARDLRICCLSSSLLWGRH